MRQRRVKSREAIIEDCRDWLICDPKSFKGRWTQVFGNSGPVFVEIGSGKGQFLTAMAKLHPENNYIAVEGGPDIMIRILQKARENLLPNLRVIGEFIGDASEYFGPEELAGIYINFCDPWPKAAHAKRRLTFRGKLEKYKAVASTDAVLAFRTDNESLFDFSLGEFAAADLTPSFISRDLHSEAVFRDMVSTEYEEKFAASGKKICYALVPLCQ